MTDLPAEITEKNLETDYKAAPHVREDNFGEFGAGKPFKIQFDVSKGLRTLVRNVITQAEERQKITPSKCYVRTVMQHLVGAMLDCSLGVGKFQHKSASTSGEQSGRHGDFFLGDVAIHVTTSPSEAVIEKCRDNINSGYRPIIVTLQKGLLVAESLSERAGLADRIDFFEIEQFITLNLYKLGQFGQQTCQVAVHDMINRYNQVVEEVETDPSFKIEIHRNPKGQASSLSDEQNNAF